MIKEKKINEFVSELKSKGVEYDPSKKQHWIGIKNLGSKKDIISNKDMKTRCENYFKDDYKLLTDSEQRNIREHIFRKLRQFEIKKQIKQLRGNKNGV